MDEKEPTLRETRRKLSWAAMVAQSLLLVVLVAGIARYNGTGVLPSAGLALLAGCVGLAMSGLAALWEDRHISSKERRH